MAVRADNGAPGASVWQLIAEATPGRLAFAVRLALICTLVAIFAEYYTTPEIALTVYVVFFLNKPDRTSSMLLTVAITIVMTIVIGLLLFLAQPVLNKPRLACPDDGADFVRDDVSVIGQQAQAGRVRDGPDYRLCVGRFRFGSHGRVGNPGSLVRMAVRRHPCTDLRHGEFAHRAVAAKHGAKGDCRAASRRG